MKRNVRTRSRKVNTTVANIVNRVLAKRTEHKVLGISSSGIAVVTTGAIVSITTPIVEGDDINQRNGTTIRLGRIRVLYRGTSVTTSSSVRFILFRDMMNQGTTPAVVDVLPSTSWISMYSDVREIQQKRFHIVHDITLDLPIAGENVKTFTKDLPLSGLVYFNGATNVSTANGKGSLFLLVIGNAVSTNYDYAIQLVYTDE